MEGLTQLQVQQIDMLNGFVKFIYFPYLYVENSRFILLLTFFFNSFFRIQPQLSPFLS